MERQNPLGILLGGLCSQIPTGATQLLLQEILLDKTRYLGPGGPNLFRGGLATCPWLYDQKPIRHQPIEAVAMS